MKKNIIALLTFSFFGAHIQGAEKPASLEITNQTEIKENENTTQKIYDQYSKNTNTDLTKKQQDKAELDSIERQTRIIMATSVILLPVIGMICYRMGKNK